MKCSSFLKFPAPRLGAILIAVAVLSGLIRVHISEVPGANAASVIVVDSTGDENDSDEGDAVCRTTVGSCTLRAAIQEANAQTGPNRIEFSIAGVGPHSISLASSLPTIDDRTGGTTIDGYSQPGATANTSFSLSNAVLAVQIVGPRTLETRTSVNALHITSDGNEVRGLAFLRLKRSVWLSGPSAQNNVIAGCFVGLGVDGQPWYDDIDAVEHRGGDPGAFGILIATGANENVIGGTARADRNVISGNANDGVAMRSRGTRRNDIIGNLIGLSPNGTTSVRNWGDGVDLNYGAASNRIGGTTTGARNVISGNAGEGIEISHGTDTAYNTVAGNFIGTDPSGANGDALIHRNTGFGISLEGDVTNNMIGPDNVVANNDKGGIEVYGDGNVGNHIYENRIGIGTRGRALPNRGDGIRVRSGAIDQTLGPGNIISQNTGAGVLITSDDVDGVVVTRNAIHDNGGLAIDIDPIGANGIDQFKHDGPNQRLNAPILARAVERGVSGVACPRCTVEVYGSNVNAMGSGDSRELLGAGVADGVGVFVVAVEDPLDGNRISALAIDADGNTSELSDSIMTPVGRGEPQVNVVPGRVEAENYRPGSLGGAYFDTSAGNQGGAYRLDSVDIRTCDTGSPAYDCYVLGFLRDGEWLEYDIWADRAGEYDVTADVAGPFGERGLALLVNGGQSGHIDVADTGSYHRWEQSSGTVELAEGLNTLRVEIVGGGFLLDGLEFAPS